MIYTFFLNYCIYLYEKSQPPLFCVRLPWLIATNWWGARQCLSCVPRHVVNCTSEMWPVFSSISCNQVWQLTQTSHEHWQDSSHYLSKKLFLLSVFSLFKRKTKLYQTDCSVLIGLQLFYSSVSQMFNKIKVLSFKLRWEDNVYLLKSGIYVTKTPVLHPLAWKPAPMISMWLTSGDTYSIGLIVV